MDVTHGTAGSGFSSMRRVRMAGCQLLRLFLPAHSAPRAKEALYSVISAAQGISRGGYRCSPVSRHQTHLGGTQCCLTSPST